MSEFPASPGPWKFGYTDDLQTPVIVDANDDVVCVIHEGVTTKDGKLMAAAPDLLQALSDLLASISGGEKSCGHAFTCICPGDKARSAIAKATGSAA